MKFKDDDPNPLLDIKVLSNLVMAKWRRQLCWVIGRYKFIFLLVAFSLCIWGLVRGPSDITESKAEVKEIPDFDYKYDDDRKVKGGPEEDGDGERRNVKESVHNYILSQREKIKSVNADIKEALLLSNHLEEELPKKDLQRSSSRLKAQPTRRNRNSLNGVEIDVSDAGENYLCKNPCRAPLQRVTPELTNRFEILNN